MKLTFIQSRVIIVVVSVVIFRILNSQYREYLWGTKDFVEWQEILLYILCVITYAVFLRYAWQLVFGADE